MGEQIDKTISFFENEIEQYEIMLGGVISDEYRKYIGELISHYNVAIYALQQLLI